MSAKEKRSPHPQQQGDRQNDLRNREQQLLQMNSEVEKKRKLIQQQDEDKRRQKAQQQQEERERVAQNDEEEVDEDEGRKQTKGSGKPKDLIDQIEEIKRKKEIELMTKIQSLKQVYAEQEEVIALEGDQLEALESNVTILTDRLINVENEIREHEGKGKALSENQKIFLQQITQTTEKYEQVKGHLKDAKFALEAVQRDKQLTEKEFEEQRENLTKVDGISAKKDIKIVKLTNELESMKVETKEKNIVQKEAGEEMKKTNEKLSVELRRLDRQKQELVAAFKKQQKLIELLKKQKTHLEIARSLNLTEEEYVKAVDLGEKL